jgi:TRAP-type C4-dicarboxylate transport system permease small subunit
MESFTKSLLAVSEKLKYVGAFLLFAMAVLTCVDVVGRLFKHPIFGSVELVSFMGVLAIATALPFTHLQRGHIGVELVVRKLPGKGRLVLELITETLGLVLFAVIAWRMFVYSYKVYTSGEVSMNLQLPEYYVILALALCLVVFCLAIILSILKTLTKLRQQ